MLKKICIFPKMLFCIFVKISIFVKMGKFNFSISTKKN